jgi:galactose mutarotase-like enzyme
MTVTIANAHLSAAVAPLGAELQFLRDAEGRDYLWDGDPAFWKGRAPLLFPIVGRLPGDHAQIDGATYPMRQHGIARISTFALVGHDATSCAYELVSDADTKTHYPFDFALRVRYALDDSTLSIAAHVENRGETAMPASFGFHPAFRWPLPDGGAKTAHTLVFDEAEPEPIRRLDDGLLMPVPQPTPIDGRVLALDESLFAADAMVFEAPRSRGVTYVAPSGRAMRVTYPGMPNLGLWSKSGAGFLCIEPWHGYAAPIGFDGDFAEKPGLVVIAPGATATFAMSIALLDA